MEATFSGNTTLRKAMRSVKLHTCISNNQQKGGSEPYFFGSAGHDRYEFQIKR